MSADMELLKTKLEALIVATEAFYDEKQRLVAESSSETIGAAMNAAVYAHGRIGGMREVKALIADLERDATSQDDQLVAELDAIDRDAVAAGDDYGAGMVLAAERIRALLEGRDPDPTIVD